MEAVAPDGVFHIAVFGNGIAGGELRYGPVESGVEDGHLWNARPTLFRGVHARGAGRIVKRRQGAEPFNNPYNVWRDKCRGAEVVTAVDYTMPD